MLIGSREGEYTGYWKGAGPSGQGTFVGKDIYTNHLDNIVYQYTGEWQYGLPCGSGMQMFSRNDELYQFATVYAGDFSAGEPNGYGTLYRKSWEGNDVYYEEAYFQDGALVGQTNFVEYDSNGKYLGAGSGGDLCCCGAWRCISSGRRLLLVIWNICGTADGRIAEMAG